MKAPCCKAGRLFRVVASVLMCCDIIKKNPYVPVLLECFVSPDALGGHERDMQIQPWRLPTAAGYGLVCGGKGTLWLWPRVPDRRKGLLSYSSAFDGGASVVSRRLAFMSYHDVFIWFICTVNESYKKCHEGFTFSGGSSTVTNSWLKNRAARRGSAFLTV